MYWGKRIKEIRDSYNLSQRRFGQKIGLSGKTISAYETVVCTPPLKVLERIANVYEVPFLQVSTGTRESLRTQLDALRKSLKELENLFHEDG